MPAWLVCRHVGLEGRAGLLAGDPGLRRQLRGLQFVDVELSRPDAGQRVRRHRVARGDGDPAAVLAAQGGLAICRSTTSRQSTCRTEPLPSRRQIVYAWMPWVLLSVMVFLWGWPAWKTMLNGGDRRAAQCAARHQQGCLSTCPGSHDVVYRTAPVVDSAAGLQIAPRSRSRPFMILTGFRRRARASSWRPCFRPSGCGSAAADFLRQFVDTLFRVRWALLTIACMLALAFTTKYSGADATLGLAFTRTGWLYPFFAPLLGWLGVALTGSDTSANALFGSLQRITAEQLKLNPVLIVASNSTGGVMGKMIDAQSIVVAAVATGQSGGEGRILRFVFFHSVVLGHAWSACSRSCKLTGCRGPSRPDKRPATGSESTIDATHLSRYDRLVNRRCGGLDRREVGVDSSCQRCCE